MKSLVPAAPALFLREAELRRGVDLLLLGHTSVTRAVDDLLAEHGLGRAHHRAMWVIGKREGATVGDILATLRVTKQSLNRVLRDLVRLGLVVQRVGERDRRQRMLRLTTLGATVEQALFDQARVPIAAAYTDAGQTAVAGFWTVLEELARTR